MDKTSALYLCVGGPIVNGPWDSAIVKISSKGEVTTIAGPPVVYATTSSVAHYPLRRPTSQLRNYDRTLVGQWLIINLGPPHAIRSTGTSVNALAAISKERMRAA
jgi:hypothetical protein